MQVFKLLRYFISTVWFNFHYLPFRQAIKLPIWLYKPCCVFGDNFMATAGLKLICSKYVSFGKDSLVGWDCLFMDTDFHFLTREDGTTTSKSGSIHIGDNNWFGCCCKVLKNTSTTNDITIAANTLLTGNYTDGGYS